MHNPTYTMVAAPESTENINQDRRVRDVEKGIGYVDPEAGPLTTLTRRGKGRTRSVYNTEFEWPEKEMLAPRHDQVNGACTTGQTTLTVDNGGYFRAGDLVQVPSSGEVVRVSSKAGNVLTIARSFGDTAAATIADNAALFILGSALAEGADVRTPQSHKESYIKNFTQTIRTEFGATNSQLASENYIGNDRVRMALEGATNHKVDIERCFLLGDKGEDVSDADGPIRATGGLIYFANKNVKDLASGVLTEPEIEDWTEDLFAHTGGSGSRLWLVSPKIASIVNQFAAARLQMVPKDDVFGLALKEYMTIHGTLMIIKHPLLVDGPNSSAGYASHSFAVDVQRVRFCHLRTRDTKLLKDRQGNGQDKFIDEYLTEFGAEVKNPAYHGILKGVEA